MGEPLFCVCGWSGEAGDRWVDSLAAHKLTQEHRLRLMEKDYLFELWESD